MVESNASLPFFSFRILAMKNKHSMSSILPKCGITAAFVVLRKLMLRMSSKSLRDTNNRLVYPS